MRILTVTHFFEQHGGGIERVAGQLCRAFQAAGHEAVWAASGLPAKPSTNIALPSWNGIERSTGIPMPVLGPRALVRLWRAIGRSDGVVIHDTLYLTSMAAMLAARLRHKPVILIQHIGALPFRNRLVRGVVTLGNWLVSRTMLSVADRVLFISATTMAYFDGLHFSAPARLLFNGVDPLLFQPLHTPRDALRARLGLPDDKLVMFFVGRFVEKKGLATIAALAKMRPDLFFVLAGKGPIIPESWDLTNVRVERSLTGAALADFYRAADRLLLPSVGEGFPLVIQEAMACGLPVICGSQSAAADPDATRFLTGVPISNIQAEDNANRIASAIDGPVMSHADRMEMADYADRTYKWSMMAAAIIDMFAEVSFVRFSAPNGRPVEAP